jgi:hypothetical protein
MDLNVESCVADPDPHGSAQWIRIRIKGKSRIKSDTDHHQGEKPDGARLM